MEGCVALSAQQKKKSSKVKVVAVNVVLLPVNVSIPLTLPKSKNRRQHLLDERRIQDVLLKHTMSSCEVSNAMIRTFQHLKLANWKYLDRDGGKLIHATKQNPGGEIVDRRGSLYILESKEDTEMRVSVYLRILDICNCLSNNKPGFHSALFQELPF